MCNAAVLEFLRKHKGLCQQGCDILEVGSANINGTPRSIFQGLARSYIGVDLVPGDGVDQVLDAVQLLSVFQPEQFDLVISAEMLEHCEDWRAAINQMKTVLKPCGHLFLTTRSPGFGYHNPPDYWRFTIDHFRRIVADFDILSLEKDSESPGVFVVADKPISWHPTDLNTIQPYPA